MTEFKPDGPNTVERMFKGWAIFIGFIAAFLIYNVLFPNHKIRNSAFVIAGFLLLIQVLQDLIVKRTFQLSFDINSRKIIITVKSLFSKEILKTISIDKAEIVTTKEKGSFLTRNRKLSIYFLDNKTKVCEINTKKDGFSPRLLENILVSAEQYQIPILNA